MSLEQYVQSYQALMIDLYSGALDQNSGAHLHERYYKPLVLQRADHQSFLEGQTDPARVAILKSLSFFLDVYHDVWCQEDPAFQPAFREFLPYKRTMISYMQRTDASAVTLKLAIESVMPDYAMLFAVTHTQLNAPIATENPALFWRAIAEFAQSIYSSGDENHRLFIKDVKDVIKLMIDIGQMSFKQNEFEKAHEYLGYASSLMGIYESNIDQFVELNRGAYDEIVKFKALAEKRSQDVSNPVRMNAVGGDLSTLPMKSALAAYEDLSTVYVPVAAAKRSGTVKLYSRYEFMEPNATFKRLIDSSTTDPDEQGAAAAGPAEGDDHTLSLDRELMEMYGINFYRDGGDTMVRNLQTSYPDYDTPNPRNVRLQGEDEDGYAFIDGEQGATDSQGGYARLRDASARMLGQPGGPGVLTSNSGYSGLRRDTGPSTDTTAGSTGPRPSKR